jgi:hypothetical protein
VKKIFAIVSVSFLVALILTTLSIPQLAFSKKYTSEKWVARYSGAPSGLSGGSAIVTDNQENIYITGGINKENENHDYLTIKYHKNGNIVWVAQYNGPADGNDTATAIALDDQGNVYVTGYSAGTDSNHDYATIKYDKYGSQIWVARYNGPGNSVDESVAVGLNSSGDVYVTGRSRGIGTQFDWATIKYDNDGQEQWVERYDGARHRGDEAVGMFIDQAGNAFVTGTDLNACVTIKYDVNGTPIWTNYYQESGAVDEPRSITGDPQGNIYVSGSNIIGTDGDYLILKFTNSGSLVWSRKYNGPANSDDSASVIRVDDTGNIYVTGSSEGDIATQNFDYATIKYDTNGVIQWVSRYDGPVSGWDIAAALIVDEQGNAYISGSSTGQSINGTNYNDFATVKYNTDGDEIWVARYNGPANLNDSPSPFAIALNKQGDVFVTGGTDHDIAGTSGDCVTIMYKASHMPK